MLAFLTGEVDDKPKRVSLATDKRQTSLGADKSQPGLGADLPRARERQSRRTKIPKDENRDIFDVGEVPTEVAPPRPRKLEDDSSICVEVKEDPSAAARQLRGGSGDGKKL